MDYGYKSIDSFTKAFAKFHETTPSKARKGDSVILFSKININFAIDGGQMFDYRIEKNREFIIYENTVHISKKDSIMNANNILLSYYNYINKDQPIMIAISKENPLKFESFTLLVTNDDNEIIQTKMKEHKRLFASVWLVFFISNCPVTKMSKTIEDIKLQQKRIFSEYEVVDDFYFVRFPNKQAIINSINRRNFTCEIWIPVTIQ